MAAMLVQSCSLAGVAVMTSAIEHKGAGMGYLAWLQFGKRTLIA